MNRELCLILDKYGNNRLVLKSGEPYEIDEYTSNFEDSSEIRQQFESEINCFLEQNNDFILKSNIPNFKGRICIVDPEQIGKEIKHYQKKVLYKKHMIVFKKIIEKKDIFLQFCKYERSKEKNLVDQYLYDVVRRPWNNRIMSFIKKWIKNEKNKKTDYYNIIRDMLYVYENEREYFKGLKTIDEIYEEYINEKEKKLQERIEKRGNLKLQQSNHTIVENSVEYEEDKEYIINGSKYTLDEITLFDIEDIDIDSSELLPDGKSRK